MARYLIHAPDYTASSAGIRCLFMLCHELRIRGHDAWMVACGVTNPALNVPIATRRQLRKLNMEGQEYTVLYPESVHGNPMGAKYVARWVLNKPGFLGGDKVYALNEKVFYYSELYREDIQNEIAGKLYMPTMDEGIFFPPQPNVERNIECFYVGKSHYKEGHIDTRGIYGITRFTPPKVELGDLFRRCKVLYSFDNYTALIAEALMCGCPVVLIPEAHARWSDIEKQEAGCHGVFWGVENYDPNFKVDTELVIRNNNAIRGSFYAQLDNFILQTTIDGGSVVLPSVEDLQLELPEGNELTKAERITLDPETRRMFRNLVVDRKDWAAIAVLNNILVKYGVYINY